MKLPKSVKVGGITYSVQQNKPVSDHTGTWGLADHDKQVIYLDPQMQVDRQAETFLHETMHTCLAANGYGRLLDDKDKQVTEEELVNALSRTLHGVITDNNLDFRA